MHRLEDVLDALVEPVGDMNFTVVQATYLALDTFSELSRLRYDISSMQRTTDRVFEQLNQLLEPAVTTEAAAHFLPVVEIAAPQVIDTALTTPEISAVAESTVNAETVAAVLEVVAAIPAESVAAAVIPDLSAVEVVEDQAEALPVEALAETIPPASAEVASAPVSAQALFADDATLDQPGVIRLTESLEASFIDLQASAAPVEIRPSNSNSAAAAAASGEIVRVPIEKLNEMIQLVSELIVNRTAFEQRMRRYESTIDEMRRVMGRLQDLASRNSMDFEARMLGGSNTTPAGWIPPQLSHRFQYSEFDALEFDRYNEFHLFSRSLLETSSDLNSVNKELVQVRDDFESLLNRQQVLSSDLQDRLMNTRMIPLSSLSAKLARAVRNVAETTGKPASLDLQGGHVLLDKTVLDELTDPLTHLLRNAVDHGLESAADRRALGKPAQARITVQAQYQGTHVVIEVRDDGQGLNTPAILRAAVENGFVSAEEAEQLDEARIHELIFQPSLTTAKELSEVSGRGVGMDVVRSVVRKLKGSVEIVSLPGHGTSFIIRIPMTLAVTRAVFVTTRGETFAIPLRDIQRIVRIDRQRLKFVGRSPVIQSTSNPQGRCM